MQLTNLVLLCGMVLAQLGGLVQAGRVNIKFRKRGSCDGVCLSYKCGTVNRGGRVVGGEPTGSNKYPWMVSFTYGSKLYCSGTLISNHFLITAAHCVQGVNRNKVTLTLGSYNKTLTDETTRQERKVGNWWAHPRFERRTYNNDIAIVKLDTPVAFTKEIRPVCLPDENAAIDYAGMRGIVAGWGRLAANGSSSDILREVTVPIMSNSECKTKGYEPRDITNKMMCAGYDAGEIDACQGDSGGPLMYKHRPSGRIDVIGVVSWGEGCALPNYPGVYTRLSAFWSFIKDKIESELACTCPPP